MKNLTQFHMDIASSIQKITENIILKHKNIRKNMVENFLYGWRSSIKLCSNVEF